jgi:hypothetical protein
MAWIAFAWCLVEPRVSYHASASKTDFLTARHSSTGNILVLNNNIGYISLDDVPVPQGILARAGVLVLALS